MKIYKISSYKFLVCLGFLKYNIVEIDFLKKTSLLKESQNYNDFKELLLKIKLENNLKDDKTNLKYAFLYFISYVFRHKINEESSMRIEWVRPDYSLSYRADKLQDTSKLSEIINVEEISFMFSNSSFYKNLDTLSKDKILIYFHDKIVTQIIDLCNHLDNYSITHENNLSTEIHNKFNKTYLDERKKAISNAKFVFRVKNSSIIGPPIIDDGLKNEIITFLDQNKITYSIHYVQDYRMGPPKDTNKIESISFSLLYHEFIKNIFYVGESVIFGKCITDNKIDYGFNCNLINRDLNCTLILDINKYFPFVEKLVIENDIFTIIKNDNQNYFSFHNSITRSNTSSIVRVEKIYDYFKLNYGLKINGEDFNYGQLEKYLYKIIKDFDNNPCLIKLNLFNKICINGAIPTNINVVTLFLNNKIKEIKKYTAESIIQLFYREIIKPKYSIQIENINNTNAYKRRKFACNQSILYFVENYFCKNEQVFKKELNHNFIISNTKQLSNEELGLRGEVAYNLYLNKFINDDKWKKNSSEELTGWCNIIWNNKESESFMPYDFSITLNDDEFFVDVKTTRKSEDSIFYITINELEKILANPSKYIIARLTYIEEKITYNGIAINEEFIVNYYRITNETIKIINDSIVQWRDYYKTNSIRFTIEHFNKISIEEFQIESQPIYEKYPTIKSEDLQSFENFIDFRLFKEVDAIKEFYNQFEALNIFFNEINSLRKSETFNKNLISDRLNYLLQHYF